MINSKVFSRHIRDDDIPQESTGDLTPRTEEGAAAEQAGAASAQRILWILDVLLTLVPITPPE